MATSAPDRDTHGRARSVAGSQTERPRGEDVERAGVGRGYCAY